MNISGWFRRLRTGLTREQLFQNIFIPFGKSFSVPDIDDADAIDFGYRSNSYWYSISKKVAESMAALPFGLYEVIEVDGEKEYVRIESGEIFEKIFYPNENQTLKELLLEAATFYLNTGDAYFYEEIEAIGFGGKRIINLPPQIVTTRIDNLNSVFSKVVGYEVNDGAINRAVIPDEMLHIMMINPNIQSIKNREGMSPMQAGWHKLNTSNNAAIAQSSYFENRGISTIISGPTTPGLSMTSADKNSLEIGMKNMLGGAHRANGVHVTPSPVQVNQLNASSTDMQMIDSQVQLLRDLCNLLFVPSVLFNDPTNSTYDNYNTAVKTFYTDVVIPHTQTFVDGFYRKYVKPFEVDGKKYAFKIVKHDIDALKPTEKEKSEKIIKLVDAGMLTPNQGLQELGFPLSDLPEMDIPRVKTNVILANEIGKENN